MAATFLDMDTLRLDQTFANRTRAGLISLCLTAANEAWSVPFHRERASFAVSVMNNTDNYYNLFASSIATDATVIADATAGGTVAITAANVAARQALVTDAHISAALLAQINAYLRAPA